MNKKNFAEATLRAVVVGVVMGVIFGAANTYLGLKSGLIIATTYPAAIISMALFRTMKGSILEENLSRTVAAVGGGSIANAAIFTIPAFYLAGIWTKFDTVGHYIISTVILFSGGLLGIMFVGLIRKVMVKDAELPFPESVATAEIHKAGRRGSVGARFLFWAMGVSGFIFALGQLSFYATVWQKFIFFAKTTINLNNAGTATVQGGMVLNAPAVSPAFLGVGYIVGPRIASLAFSGGVLAWGFFVPLVLYILSPQLISQWQVAHIGQIPASADWINWSVNIWKAVVRPIAIGGMLVSVTATLYRMRKNLTSGLVHSVSDLKKNAAEHSATSRVEKDLGFKWTLIGIGIASLIAFIIFYYFTHDIFIAVVASVITVIMGFLFTTIAGYLCGVVGTSNNPLSGLTLTGLIVFALLMLAFGVGGQMAIALVLGFAATICATASIGGDSLQELKAGYILGATPWRIQVSSIIGIAVASAIMFLPLIILHQGDINAGLMATPAYVGGFGSIKLAAPQAGLIALVTQGIVGGQMAWPLIGVGILFGIGLLLMRVQSPMVVTIGMYLPLETTSAIFIGGVIKSIVTWVSNRKKFNEAQQVQVENTGILVAAGLIAGEALIGLLVAVMLFFNIHLPAFFKQPSYFITLLVFVFIAGYLIWIPISRAADEIVS
jgi:putative OPT family oligopeptide transporter